MRSSSSATPTNREPLPSEATQNAISEGGADARTRTGDPFITSEVLYQLSYVGNRPTVAVPCPSPQLSSAVDDDGVAGSATDHPLVQGRYARGGRPAQGESEQDGGILGRNGGT
jgi:hypothetical protein